LPKRKPAQERDEEQQAGARPFWSGTLSFGLVSIPVNLYPANRDSRVSLRTLGPVVNR
jgi:DNA end-binding protein Ku